MLELYTIYDRPADHPSVVVLRRWVVDGGSEPVPAETALCQTVDEARAVLIAHGLTCIPREVDDDPAIVETWL